MEGSSIQFQLEKEVAEAKVNMTTSIERYFTLERELARVRTELTKALKWTFSP